MSETKRAMVSQPMNGKTEEEIAAAWKHASAELLVRGFIPIVAKSGRFYDDDYPGEEYPNRPLFFLACSLLDMASCEAVYFCKGWENARGCRIEHEAAKAYGLEIICEE